MILEVDVAHRFRCQQTVRKRIDGLVIRDNLGTAHPHFADDSLQTAHLDTVAEFERTVKQNHDRAEKIGKRIFCRQSRAQSEHSRARQQSGDIDLENALTDKQDRRCKHDDPHNVAEHFDHQVIQIVVVPLRKPLEVGIDHPDHVQSRPGGDHAQYREEETHVIQKYRFFKRNKDRIKGEEDSDHSHR